jgi:hypothetical protein
MLSNPIDRAMIVHAAFLFSGLGMMLAFSTFWKTLANTTDNRETDA